MTEELKNNEEISTMLKAEVYRKDGFPATFVGQTFTKLVLGRSKWKVKNTYPPSCKDPISEHWLQENYPKELTELEQLYNEFCKKAFSLLMCHPRFQGGNLPSQIIFPDFYYEVIPSKFPVE